MAQDRLSVGLKVVIGREGIGALIAALAGDGWRVLGPRARDGAIVYDDVAGLEDLPAGWTETQEAGRYRLERRADAALFGYAVGPHSWKRFLHPPVELLWRARREGDGVAVSAAKEDGKKFAFLGVRACELAAIAIQDRVFIQGPYPDTAYRTRRENAFFVAVNCGEAGGTCFCVSMKTGPKAEAGFDLALTELIEDGLVEGRPIECGRHRFLVEVGSEAGGAVLAGLPHAPASPEDISAAEAVTTRTASRMGRRLETDGLKELLQANPEHPRWDEVARRCLACANCTMVCPTCFCTTIEDVSALDGTAERMRKWDSCFSLDFSYIHGGSVRKETKSRYRQWMTHKLANWIDQFGTSGCVGCGRCVTWCPVGIDITEEAAAIRASVGEGREAGSGRA
ncbi:MAG TPA: 4Fe-4S dicluster domain-containing protein [Acetobacteraceae bacterium]|nr:4Fe-4S dicluster domain-containing protein [Acetobacteraceae bacterium]